jgi:hypothetical protein
MIRSITAQIRLDNPSALDAENMTIAMTNSGDLITRTASAFANIAIGAANTRLTSNGTSATWVADTQNTVVDAKGDLLVGTADNTVAKFVLSATNGQVLTVDNTDATYGMSWQTPYDYLGLIVALGG